MYNPHASLYLQRLLRKLKRKRKVSEEFTFRISILFQDLHRQYMHIYGDHPDSEKKLERLVQMMADYHATRPEDLKRTDEQRERNPQWYLDEHLTGMMLYVDRFAEDLNGLKNKLYYFDELGINLLHLMPLLKSPKTSNDGGYA
ncbi:MAG: hypothetical protein P8X57_08690, partial [Cyclobacteriaceae bacterium]